MPAPMIVPIALMGAAALGVAAMDSSRKKARVSEGTRRTYTLDAGLPPSVRDQILAALTTEESPDKLEAFATAIAPSYPLSAAALRSKALARRTANTAAPTSSRDVPNALDPLATIPEPAHTQIADQLARQTDPNALEAYATQLAPIYPQAATLLRVRAMQIRTAAIAASASPPTSPPISLPTPPPIVAAPPIETSSSPTALPTPPVVLPEATPLPVPPPIAAPPAPPNVAPATVLAGLDPGMPVDVQKAVLGALTAETDPTKLEGFASAIQAQYPIAAGLLVGRALALRGHGGAATLPPASAPAPTLPGPPSLATTPILSSTPAAAPPAPSPTVPMTVSPYKMGDDRTRTGRNALRPSGFPFVLLRPTDVTYPAKIAKEATGYEGNFGEMTTLNPHLAPEGKWINLVAGDALNVPWTWAPTLARIYQVQTDPGVTPSTSPVASAAPLLTTASTSSANSAPIATPPAIPAAPATPYVLASTTSPAALPSATLPPATYTVKPGDSPSRIAGNLVHDQGRWHELVAANPSKRTTADGNFASLMPGEVLVLPASWMVTSTVSAPSAIGGSHGAFA